MTYSTKTLLLRVAVPLLLVASAFAVPVTPLGSDVTSYFTTVSVLFAILLGFFIATATTNYLRFQEALAEEGTALVLLFNLGVVVRPSVRDALAEAIDRYVISTLDFRLSEYVEGTAGEFGEVLALADTLEPEDGEKRRAAALSALYDARRDVLRARTSITFSARRVMRATHWGITVLLAAIMVALTFAQRDGGVFSSAIAGVFFASVYLILLLLYEVDGNVFLEEQLAFEDTQSIFRAIGRLEYYPSYALEQGLATPPDADYRVGVYVDRTQSNAKSIRVVKRGGRA